MLQKISDVNVHVFKNLAQAYEAEFSSITAKIPDKNGVFALDTILSDSIIGYIWLHEKSPVGFALVDLAEEPFNVCEFYIIPSLRKNKLGKILFLEVLNRHPGQWQVKQLPSAIHATSFWRAIIKEYTSDNFREELYVDKYWGEVLRQLFKTNS
jgi:predicted acetyltransferase